MIEYGLVGDIGGTNARLGLVPIIDEELNQTGILAKRTYLCEDYESISSLINCYIASIDEYPRPLKGVIAIACPVENDRVSFVNIDWNFSIKKVQQETGFKELSFINDLYAHAYSVSPIIEKDVLKIGAGNPVKYKPIAVIGPGSGLGASLIIPGNQKKIVLNSEGGHTGFSPVDDVELDIATILIEKFGRLSNERLLSGHGIENLYLAIAQIRGKLITLLSAPDIMAKGLSGECEICTETLDRFCMILGTFAGDFALSTGALGGVYLTGGIIPRFVEYLCSSLFRRRFEEKGRFRDYMKKIPTYVMANENSGLYGAAKIFLMKA